MTLTIIICSNTSCSNESPLSERRYFSSPPAQGFLKHPNISRWSFSFSPEVQESPRRGQRLTRDERWMIFCLDDNDFTPCKGEWWTSRSLTTYIDAINFQLFNFNYLKIKTKIQLENFDQLKKKKLKLGGWWTKESLNTSALRTWYSLIWVSITIKFDAYDENLHDVGDKYDDFRNITYLNKMLCAI